MTPESLRRLLVPVAIVVGVLVVISFALGSGGETEGSTSTGQDIANVTFPLALAGLLLLIGLAAWYRVKRRSDR